MVEHAQAKENIIQRLTNWAAQPASGNSASQRFFHSLLRILIITAREFNRNELNIRASALTYTILLSLVPILAMSTAVVKGLGGGDQLRQVVYSYIDTLEETTPITHGQIPGDTATPAQTESKGQQLQEKENASITTHLRSAANQLFDYVDRTDFATLGTFGVLGILLSAVLVLGNIELAMNTIWHVPAGRSLIRKVTDYLTFLFLMPLSINFGFAANTVLKNDTLLHRITGFLPAFWIKTALLLLVPLFFITLTLFLIYIFFPNTKVKTIPALIGALFAGAFWFLTQNLYIGLQVGVSKYNAIYGSFATLPLFLVWIFLGWVFILSGAQLAYACQRHHSYQLQKLSFSPLEQLSAAFDILSAVLNSYNDKKKIKQKDLSACCSAYSVPLLHEATGKLLKAELLLSTQRGALLPAAPSERIHQGEVVAAILGNAPATTPGGKTTAALLEQATPFLSKSFTVEEMHEP